MCLGFEYLGPGAVIVDFVTVGYLFALLFMGA